MSKSSSMCGTLSKYKSPELPDNYFLTADLQAMKFGAILSLRYFIIKIEKCI